MSVTSKRSKVLFLPVTRGFYNRALTQAACVTLQRVCRETGVDGTFPDAGACTEGLIHSDADVRRYFELWRADLADIKALIVFSGDFMSERAVLDTVRLLPEDVPVFLIVHNDDPGDMSMERGTVGDSLCGSLSVHCNLRLLGRRVLRSARIDMGNSEVTRDVLREYVRIIDGIEVCRGMRIGLLGVNPVSFATTFANQPELFRLGFSLHTYELLELWGNAFLPGCADAGDLPGRLRLTSRVDPEDERLAGVREALLKMMGDVQLSAEELDVTCRCFLWVKDRFERDGIDAGAIHCWPEFEQFFGVRPCLFAMLCNVLLGKPLVCEVDACHAIMARLAWTLTGEAGVILDFNNNGWDRRVFNVFHCSQTPPNWLRGSGTAKASGEIEGRIVPVPFTGVAAATSAEACHALVFTGHFLTEDPGLRGSSGWAFVPNLPEVLAGVETSGIHHFVAMKGNVASELAHVLRFRGLRVEDLSAEIGRIEAIEAKLPALKRDGTSRPTCFSRK